MTLLISLLLALGLAWGLAYRGASLALWSGALVAYLLALAAVDVLATGGLLLALAVAVPLLAVLNVTAWRRRLITARVFGPFRRALPPMTQTEQEALEAGDVWWEADLFRGRPDWRRLLDLRITRLSAEEQAFLDDQVERLCAMLDEDQIVRQDHDLAPEVWEFLKRERFFSLIIPREYGGRQFSSLAQSAVVAKVSTRSLSAAVSVMVPNSLGPGELLMKYGTGEQKDYWLPRLTDGREIPCFALTGPDVGSDAGSMPDYGVVCKGRHDGQEVLGIRVNFSKRYITLAPVATVVGLAFKLFDPDHLLGERNEIGITCALVPADHPGVKVGRRHFPMGLAFQNGPVEGEDVFIPMDWIIGGPQMAGRGWRMLVECLSVGRAISLPALATAAGKLSYRMTGAYARIRRQFKLPIGRFEGVQEAMARIGGSTYMLEAARTLTASAGDLGIKPSVVSAIAKYHMTETMRRVIDDAMDIHAGRSIIFGPRNYLGYAYQATPVAITVEGANILTRNLMIFGQGAIRCHPYVLAEMQAAADPDEPRGLAAFDQALFGHIGYSINRAVRAFTLGLTGARLAGTPVPGPNGRHFQQLERMSAALALTSDVAMGVLGGDLKRRERLSARLGDVLSHLYLASAVLKYHEEAGRPAAEQPYVDWCLAHALHQCQQALDEFFQNFPRGMLARAVRRCVFPLGRPFRAPADHTGQAVAEAMMKPGGVRERLGQGMYLGHDADDPTGRMEHTFNLLVEVEPLYERFLKAASKPDVQGFTFEQRLAACVANGALTEAEAEQVRAYEALRYDAILTDAMDPAELAPRNFKPAQPGRRVA